MQPLLQLTCSCRELIPKLWLFSFLRSSNFWLEGLGKVQVWAKQSACLGWDVLALRAEMLQGKSGRGTGIVAKRSMTKASLGNPPFNVSHVEG